MNDGERLLEQSGELIRVLLVEDDPGDELLTSELLLQSGFPFLIASASRLSDALVQVDKEIECVLLDLGLPDAQGLAGLAELLARAPNTAVIVLTGRADRDLALDAVAAGAQDYLNKGAIDADLLTRSIRYSVERKRSEESARQLLANELMAAESARLERGLLARPLLWDPRIATESRYRSGARSLLLGGDFFDAIELVDGTIRIVIGDVAGHGPDEAALGVALRIAWRSLVLSGVGADVLLPGMQAVLVAERDAMSTFATVCDATISADRHSVSLRVAGHPAPLLINDIIRELPVASSAPPLGVVDGLDVPEESFDLGAGWTLLFYTDGIVEGRSAESGERFGISGLESAIERWHPSTEGLGHLADLLLGAAESANGGPVADDIALFLVSDMP